MLVAFMQRRGTELMLVKAYEPNCLEYIPTKGSIVLNCHRTIVISQSLAVSATKKWFQYTPAGVKQRYKFQLLNYND